MSSSPLLNIVFVEPEIPQNTGNTGRTCVGFNCHLHLVGPLGFDISEKNVRRAGLDYWSSLTWFEYSGWSEWWSKVPDKSRVFFLSTKVDKAIYDHTFKFGDWLVFGKETKGLDEAVLQAHPEQCLTIPFPGVVRSFNLSNSAAIVMSEGFRQLRPGQ